MKLYMPTSSVLLSVAIACSGVGIASADPVVNAGGKPVESAPCNSQHSGIRGADLQLACRIVDIGTSLVASEDGKSMRTTLSDQQLISTYGFTSTQVQDLHAILSGTYVATTGFSEYSVASFRSVTGARFYISNRDLKAGAFAVIASAASAGPEALAAAFVAVSSMIGGPVGTTLAAGVSLLGIGFFADLAIKITGALVQGKGVAFYGQWGFPPIVVKIE